MSMNKRRCVVLLLALLVAAGLVACHKTPAPKPESRRETTPKVGPVRMNPHPASLAGKTVVLRWNGQCNGDTLLNNLAELLKKETKQVKIVKMWEVDASTAVISDGLAMSQTIAEAVASQKPALVIAAQADSGWGRCLSSLVVDQLTIEKKGIPTVTIVTSQFKDQFKGLVKEQGVTEMAYVVVQHPIGGLNFEGIQHRASDVFPDVLEAAKVWQPTGT
jgi:ABC-type Fe3+-hydroxamate transport system substrate-binding protein